MPIQRVQDRAGSTYLGYVPPPFSQLTPRIEQLCSIAHICALKHKITQDMIAPRRDILCEIYRRLDQRMEYYKIFHGNRPLNELRQMAIIAYWVLKYKPFRLVNEYSCTCKSLNEETALYLIKATVNPLRVRNGKGMLKIPADHETRILRAFAEHDISKEAMMVVVEAMYAS